MRSVEKEGKTAEEAIEKALEELGVGREQAQIEILSEPNHKIFRFLAGRGVRIRVTVPEEDPLLNEAKGLLHRVLEQMGIQCEVSAGKGQDCLLLELRSQEAGLLIGRKGETLDALQYLLNRILNPDGLRRNRVILDAEGYRARKREETVSFAHRAAEKAKSAGREIVLVPLGPYERRIIHITLQEDPEVNTFSEGEGYLKRVHVVPVKAA
jgi:spoIIIJ-associated protein